MIYGKDFAAIYDRWWTSWGERMWPRYLGLARRACPGARSWLDLCCGTGALLQRVRSEGFRCAGVDASRAMIRIARRRVPSSELSVQDLRRLSVAGTFDVISCTYDSLNYLTAARDLWQVFRRVRGLLDPRGVFLFDMNTGAGMQDNWRSAFVLREREDAVVVEASFDARRALGTCRITGFLREGRRYRRFEEVHIERGYWAGEIDAFLLRAGWRFQRLDAETLGRVRRRSPRLLYLCKHGAARTDGAPR
jgi:SAM-dependent methyltransferase